MAPFKKAASTKKNQLQLKKGKKVVEVQQEEDNDNEDMDNSDEEEDDHEQESDNVEDKELNMDLKNDEGDEDENDDDESDEDEEKDDDKDDDEDDDMDECFPKKKQVTVEKKKQASENTKEQTRESRGESDARSLYIGKLPDGVTEQDLKDLSKDIVEIYFPQKMHGGSNRFAFIRFADEATAESNLTILQTKTIKDQPLTVDYCGSKSSFNKDLGREDRNAKKLFIGNLPDDVTESDLRSLSEDIVEMYISQGSKKFAFITFDSKDKAESNYKSLKDQKIRGREIFVDYNNSKGGGVKQISVSGLPLDVTIEQVATHFKKAFQITLNRSNSFRTATISFDTEEEAKEANDAAKDATISEHKLTSVLCENTENRPERGGPFGGRGQFRGGRGQFRGGRGQFRGGRNNWGKRSHDGGNFHGGRGGFAKKMRN